MLADRNTSLEVDERLPARHLPPRLRDADGPGVAMSAGNLAPLNAEIRASSATEARE
eukprot:COSAG02_NODE_8090_length_2714_cov_18.828681_5_plen_56_part_01